MNNENSRRVSLTIELERGGYLPEPRTLRLLLDIRETGSINRSAGRLGLSYTTAWRCLREAEQKLPIRLLAPQKGGRGGGGTALTPEGDEYVRALGAMLSEAQALVDDCCKRYFPDGGLPGPAQGKNGH